MSMNKVPQEDPEWQDDDNDNPSYLEACTQTAGDKFIFAGTPQQLLAVLSNYPFHEVISTNLTHGGNTVIALLHVWGEVSPDDEDIPEPFDGQYTIHACCLPRGRAEVSAQAMGVRNIDAWRHSWGLLRWYLNRNEWIENSLKRDELEGIDPDKFFERVLASCPKIVSGSEEEWEAIRNWHKTIALPSRIELKEIARQLGKNYSYVRLKLS